MHTESGQISLRSLTSESLLERVRDWDDAASWQQFFTTYHRVVISFATKSGLNTTEAEDVAQNTMFTIAERIRGFQYDRSNQAPYHCLHGFADFLSQRLGVEVRPTLFRGDVHLSADEQRWKSTVHELAGRDLPFWIINAGGKFDFPIKWWDWRRYQQVVDHFRGKILFVQVGEIGHYHPPLRHVVDLRGRVDLRQLVRRTYHAQGVLCGVTALMHLAAAVPARPDRPSSRAAVIVAGGREPTHWEAYPHHQFIHTIGALPCCLEGGCWRARTRAIGDGEPGDAPDQLCLRVRKNLPRCMDMITAEGVIRRVETYFAGGANAYLAPAERAPRAARSSAASPARVWKRPFILARCARR